MEELVVKDARLPVLLDRSDTIYLAQYHMPVGLRLPADRRTRMQTESVTDTLSDNKGRL